MIPRGGTLEETKFITEEEIIDAIKFAESEYDWEEVERLYKILFQFHDNNQNKAA
jgi:hypothetical protein